MVLRRAQLGPLELEYETRGTGEPVVFIHGGVFADWFEPVLAEPALANHTLLRYHRVGYAGSSRCPGSVSIADQAAHARALLHALGIERAHVVGHSSGGTIALQLARDAPGAVRSLVLLEPVLMQVPSGPTALEALERYRSGDPAAAVDAFMRGVCGADYRAVLDRVLPDSFERGTANADAFFGRELPALRHWAFGAEDTARVAQPILAVMGERSDAVRLSHPGAAHVFAERQKLLLAWFPAAEAYVLPRVDHSMPVQDPHGLAHRLAAFFARHPMKDA